MSKRDGTGKGSGGRQWPAATCTRLALIQQNRDAAKAEETDLKKERKSLHEELIELGAGNTDQHFELSREYVVALMRLEVVRARIDRLADLADKTIRKAEQPELFEEDNSDIVQTKRLTEKGVFSALRKVDKAQRTFDEGQPGQLDASHFPGVFRLTPTPKHPGDGKEQLVECDNPAMLSQKICKHLGGEADEIDEKTGDVTSGEFCTLRVTFVKHIKEAKSDTKAA